jgi:spermidine synthase
MAGLALCLVGSAGMALVAAAAVDWSLLAVARVVARPDATFGGVLLRQVLLVTVLLAPMTIAFGAAFPFAVAVAARSDDTVIGDLGLVYAVNTAGAILGALASGFALIPWLGLLGSIRLVATIAALGAAVMVVVPGTRARGRIAVFAASVGVLAAAVAMPPWNYLLLSSGAYKYAPSLRGPDLETALTAGELRYYREGAAGTVAVRDLTGTRSLAIDGKVDASNSGDMLTQRLLAHLPLLLHESPREVAILGLGSGVTLGSALRHPIARATVLEISPGSSTRQSSSATRTTTPLPIRARVSWWATAGRTCSSVATITT